MKFFFGVWCSNQRSGLLDDNKPTPVSESHILSEVTLGNLNELPLISFLLINLCFDVFVCLTLHHSQKLDNNVISCLLKTSKGTSSEEHKGMAKTISLTIKANLVHQGICSNLIIRRAGNLCSSKDCITHLEVWVEHTIREAPHADPDTLQHTITSQLMHDKWGFYISRFLVGIWHKTADKVRLTTVKSSHELTKRDKIDRGDSLATTSLLLLLSFFLGGSGRLTGMVPPEMNQKNNR